MEYLKLAHVAQMIVDGDFTKAALLEGIVVGGVTRGEYVVVNLKGRILTRDEVDRDLRGTLDGETVTA